MMKILFAFALLINIIVFLWEYNRGDGGISVNQELNWHKPKQILLLAEVEAIKFNGSTDINVDRIYELSELKIASESELLPTVVGNNHLLTPSLSQPIEKLSKVSFKKIVDVNKTVERNRKSKDIYSKTEKQIDDSLFVNGDKQQHKTLKLAKKKIDLLASQTSLLSLKKTTDDEKQSIHLTLDENNKADVKKIETETVCYQVGPFESTRNLAKWSKRNKINENSLKQLSKDRKLNIRHLVYYPAAKTFAQSKENVRMLRKKGISEYWLIRKGALKGAVSLGLFSREKSAQGLQKKLLRKELKVFIKQKFNKKPVFYAQVSSSEKRFKDTVKIKKKQRVSLCDGG